MPISGTPKPYAFCPFSRRSHAPISIVPKAAYDLVLEAYRG